MDQHSCIIRIDNILNYSDVSPVDKLKFIGDAIRELKEETDRRIKATGYKFTVYRNYPGSGVTHWEYYKTETGANRAHKKNLEKGFESEIKPYNG